MPNETFQSASGGITSRRGYITFPQIAIAATATASATVAFAGAEVGDQCSLSPNAALGAGAVLSFTRVSAAGVLEIHVGNCSTAAVTIATQSACAVCVNHI